VSLWSVIALYIAGMIGAGFASGQELVVFFVSYGKQGLAGIALTISLLTLGTALILEVCARHNISSYAELFSLFGPSVAKAFDWLYSVFLLIGTSVMLAGIGAQGSTALPKLMLQFGTVLLILAALYKGAVGVSKVSAYLAPCLVIILCALTFEYLPGVGERLLDQDSWASLDAGTLYASYNLGFSLAVLASVQPYLKTKKERWIAVLVGNLVLGTSMVLLFLALSTLGQDGLQSAFPLRELVVSRGPLALRVYQVMLWGSMYSTALAHLLALVSRMQSLAHMTWGKATLLATGASLALSHLGFGPLIRIAYPILGLAGLWILANLGRILLFDRKA